MASERYPDDDARREPRVVDATGAEVRRPSSEEVSRWELPVPAVRFIATAWMPLWILMFVFGFWQVGLALLFLTGPVMAALHASGRPRRERERERRKQLKRARYDERVLRQSDAPHEPGPPRRDDAGDGQPQAGRTGSPGPSGAERALAGAVVRAETSGGRLDADALELVREIDQLLRPLLAHVRTRGADAAVRHDLEALAREHLPQTLDAYLVLPVDYAHDHRTPAGPTPADELRAQLTLLVEGCRQLRDAVHDADLSRQAELGRFLDAKFRRSDLDL